MTLSHEADSSMANLFHKSNSSNILTTSHSESIAAYQAVSIANRSGFVLTDTEIQAYVKSRLNKGNSESDQHTLAQVLALSQDPGDHRYELFKKSLPHIFSPLRWVK